ncbi:MULTISPECIES: hypothetical protein [unclassified Rickettsia]|uniref:hypothetical protein n=1 Tax=unclassified Rickettsia TaxID=114295 RepID=UPI00209EC8F0|nr:hypothetical protein [Rickettsia endosymbiont of Ceutorhynchus assimilis]
MLAIIGSLVGFFSSFVPEVFNFFKDKKDKEHELKLINLQIEAAKANENTKLEAVKIQADTEESKYLYLHAAPSKVKWVDAFAALVRPFITYAFFGLYVYLKIILFGGGDDVAIAEIWNDEDRGIFGTVIGFWFGNRAFNKNKQ